LASLHLTIMLLAILLQFQMQTPTPQVLAASDNWIDWARTAWRYFQPGVGVHPGTGLSYAGYGWHYFTDWDLGTYIFAILDAEEIGILPRTEPWGSTYRLNKIMDFLRARDLTSFGTSYVLYSADTGYPASLTETNVSDLGQLLIALHRLRTLRRDYTSKVQEVIARENLARFASDSALWAACSSEVYRWYVAHGFEYFGFDTYQPVKDALGLLQEMLDPSFPQVDTGYGVWLPKVDVTSEPLLLAAFTLPIEQGFPDLLWNAYLAQKNRYDAEGHFTGFSEGNTGLNPPCPTYVYEWIVTADGEKWVVKPSNPSCPFPPIAYVKVGFGFYALYGTQYAADLINHAKTEAPNGYGYLEGVDENGRPVSLSIDRTQAMVLAGARYVSQASQPIPFNQIVQDVVDASSNTAWVVMPDYTYSFDKWHASAPKCGGRSVAQVSDIYAATYLLGSFANRQNEILDTNSAYISQSDCGFPSGISASSPIVAIAGFGVNEVGYRYVEGTSQSQLYVSGGCIFRRDTGANVFCPGSPYNPADGPHGLFVIESFNSVGRPVYLVWGWSATGTLAATAFVVEFVLKNPDSYAGSWYVYTWDDAASGVSANSIPDAGDTFTQRGAG